MHSERAKDFSAAKNSTLRSRSYDPAIVQRLQKARFQRGNWEIDDESVVLLWKEANVLSQMCKEISSTSKEEAEKNVLGFQYGDRFVHY